MSRNKAVFTVRPVWVTNGCRSAVVAMLCSSLRMLQFRLGIDWLCRSTKQGFLSFAPAHIRVGPNTLFSTAAAAAAAAAAACFCCGCLCYCCCCSCCCCCCCCCCCLLLLWVPLLLLLLLHCLLVLLCFIFYSNSSAKAIWYTQLSTTAVSPFLYCLMSWWVNSWISVELQLCCGRNKSRVRASH